VRLPALMSAAISLLLFPVTLLSLALSSSPSHLHLTSTSVAVLSQCGAQVIQCLCCTLLCCAVLRYIRDAMRARAAFEALHCSADAVGTGAVGAVQRLSWVFTYRSAMLSVCVVRAMFSWTFCCLFFLPLFCISCSASANGRLATDFSAFIHSSPMA